jgi:hypothetical protein
MSPSFYKHLSLTEQATHESCDVSLSLVYSVGRTLGSIKGHDHPPSKADSTHSFDPHSVAFQASSSSTRDQVPALLRHYTHSSFLKLCITGSPYSNTEKMDIGYYAPAARTTLNLCVLVFILTPLSPRFILL